SPRSRRATTASRRRTSSTSSKTARPGPPRERQPLQGELPDAADPPAGCLFRTRCPFATDLCRTAHPELREIAPGRSVRCHLPLDTATEEPH
ncbi:oligopeptide/dipeptide ABC transporter ATP-binding protein, partial [Streptomyces sp. NPDC005921]